MDSAGQGNSFEVVHICSICKKKIDRKEYYLEETKENALLSDVKYFHKECYARKILVTYFDLQLCKKRLMKKKKRDLEDD